MWKLQQSNYVHFNPHYLPGPVLGSGVTTERDTDADSKQDATLREFSSKPGSVIQSALCCAGASSRLSIKDGFLEEVVFQHSSKRHGD